MFPNISNRVKRAVGLVGGPTKVAHKLGVSNATVHTWIKQQRVPNIDKAKMLAEASGIELQRLRYTK